MGQHARPTAGLARRLTGLGLAGAVVVAAAAGVWALGRDGNSPSTTASSVPPTVAPTSSTTLGTTASSTTTTTGPVARPYGGEAVMGVGSEPITLNPFLEGGNADTLRLIGRPVWAGAFALHGLDFDPIPVLAGEIPTAQNGGLVSNEDGTVSVTYRLDPAAVWEDGTPVTGADFAFTYELVTNPSLPIRADVREPYRSIVPGSLEVSDTTVGFDLAAPSLAYLEVFSIVVPAAQVEGTDFVTAWGDAMWWSAGPFRFEEWRPGAAIVLTRNERYWEMDPETGQQLPYLDQLVFAIVETGATSADMAAGRFDIVAPLSDPGPVLELREVEGVHVDIGWGPSWEHLSFQFGPGRFARNPESVNEHLAYRQAVAFITDRRAVAQAAYQGLVPPLDSPVAISWPRAASTGWSIYQPSEDQAEAALAELERDTEVVEPQAVLTSNVTPERSAALEALGGLFSGSGINLEVEPPEETGVFFLETVGPGSFDLAEWAWVPEVGPSKVVADLRRWFSVLPEQGGSNFSRWGSSVSAVQGDEVERLSILLDEMGRETDLDRLQDMISEAEQLMADLVVTIPLYAELNAGAVWATEIGGYAHSIMPGGDTWNAAFWYRADA